MSSVVTEESDVFGAAKQVAEQRTEPAPDLMGALHGTICPNCQRTVGALVIDGPDPVFVDLQCPRDVCGHEWSERVS
ncbi:hypothetical protein KZC52_16905 [Microbacterium sp. kSW2-24]|uniref:hypothetical protein n=1 Tax=Microbacterium galbinum TaxID=2851646 RepID=UPI001FFD254F|nr:hypothetical protein [Microbacterium galbinum]MCK2024610.1 hypothetical protein [Microbacterium galbinum]